MARKILGRFGSIKGVMAASEKDLMRVFRIGEVKASYIFDALRVRYNSDGRPE